MEKITSVMLVVTHKCNLRCRYCFVHKKPETMTYQVAKDTVDYLIKNVEGTKIEPSINFFGGEPTLCWDSIIVPLTNYIRKDLKVPFKLSMTTNGILLNKKRMKFMKDNEIGMLFSIDGAKETQDYNRPYPNGKSSFDTLEKIIPDVAKNFHPTFRMTIIPKTCECVFENIKFAEANGFTSFFIIPNVFEEWTDEEWDRLSKEVHKYGDYYISCYEEGKQPIQYSEIEKGFKEIVAANNAVKNNLFRTCQGCNKCGLGFSRFASVHPNGDIFACQELTSWSGPGENIFHIGNIYTGIDEEKRQNLGKLFDAKKIFGEDCTHCKMFRICDGGCVANNFLSTGDVNHPSKYWCKWKQLVFDESIRIARALGNNAEFIAKWRRINGR